MCACLQMLILECKEIELLLRYLQIIFLDELGSWLGMLG